MQNNLSRFLFGERLPWLPPERVRQTFAEQESQSEILVGWVQLVLVGFFIAIYSLSPKTSAGTAFQPVPWVLGVYLFVTLLRLWLSYRTVLPGWLLMASIVIDMALLMGLIWSFHIQYEQPPSFYLKAPTVLYVFIFIAVRALRFSPRYVIVSGIVAALGWLALAGYVMVAEPGDPMITRDYVEYMTSNHILVGAEVDKIMSILVVTGVLAVALVRARRTMIQAVTETAAARELSRFVPTEIAARITRSDTRIAPGDGEVKEATILFTDIEGFSSVSEHLAPDALARMLNDYFAAISAILGRTGGVINQFQGDALLITFNTVRPDPDHATHAVQTALEIQALVGARTFGDGAVLKTRCGISTGRVVSGAVGTDDMLIYTVHGDQVNVAARLEALNKDFGTYVMVSESTVAACTQACRFTPLAQVTVRGRQAPVQVYGVAESA